MSELVKVSNDQGNGHGFCLKVRIKTGRYISRKESKDNRTNFVEMSLLNETEDAGVASQRPTK